MSGLKLEKPSHLAVDVSVVHATFLLNRPGVVACPESVQFESTCQTGISLPLESNPIPTELGLTGRSPSFSLIVRAARNGS